MSLVVLQHCLFHSISQLSWGKILSAKISNGVFFIIFFSKMSLFCSYLLYESLFLLQRVNGLGTFHENLTRDMTWLGDRGVGAGGGSGGLPSATTSSGQLDTSFFPIKSLFLRFICTMKSLLCRTVLLYD